MADRPASAWMLLLRLVIYAGVQMGVMFLHLRMTTDPGDAESARTWLAEGSWIEWIQVAVLGAIFLVVATSPARRSLVGKILLLAVLATVAREMDTVLTAWLWKNAHRVLMIVFGVAALGLCLMPGNRAHEAFAAFIGRPAFWLMGFGFTLVVIYALVLGQNAMWLPNSAPGFDRINKRFVEEGLELCGYLWILFGAIELRLSGPASPRA